MGSTFGLGLRKLFIKGQRAGGLLNIASYPVSPIITLWNGARIKKAYTQQLESISSPKTRRMVEAIIAAGGRDRMDVFYYNNQIKVLQKTFSDIVRGDSFTKIKGALKLPFNIFGATLESVAKPLMEWYVPTGKIGLFSKLAGSEMKRAEKGSITDDQLWEMLTKVWDSVDNRMGMLVYDNLFWNKTLKDVLMLAIRSVGWNLGFGREYGGAVVDLATVNKRIEQGDIWLSHKMSYVIGVITTYAIMGAITTYILTGEKPKELKDYFFPNGPDGRWFLATYAKDIYAWSHRPIQTAIHKIHPLWGLLGDLVTNKDFFNVEIRHPEDPLLAQSGEIASHIFDGFKSISIRNYEKMSRVSSNKKRNILISITGISSAPSYITRSPAQKLMARILAERIPHKTRTKEEFERSTYRKVLKDRLRKGEVIDRKEAIDMLGHSSYRRLLRESRLSSFADSFNRLGLEDALNVYSISNKREREQVKRILRRKYTHARSHTKTKEIRDLFHLLMRK
jgi:hypothetical protein